MDLVAAALGGRVAHSEFLSPDDAAEMLATLKNKGVQVHVSGGYAGAKRRVITVFPEHIPEADTPLTAVYFEGVNEQDVLAALRQQGVNAGLLGDTVVHTDGVSVITLAAEKQALLKLSRVAMQDVTPQEVSLDKVASGKRKTQLVIVPSLRVDVLGAKAFNVSRSYFSKGVAGGNVKLNGKLAGKSSSASAGDEVYAEGLGRFYVGEVQGETKRGNLKVELEIERA